VSYFYISNPYNGTEEQKEERATIAAKVCGMLLKKGLHAWSPIVHNHAMMKTFNEFTLEERQSKILDFDFSLLKKSDAMIVLTIDGWDKSYGVGKEIELCKKLDIEIKYLNPSDLDLNISVEELLKDNPQ
jgi:hypothetical protein